MKAPKMRAPLAQESPRPFSHPPSHGSAMTDGSFARATAGAANRKLKAKPREPRKVAVEYEGDTNVARAALAGAAVSRQQRVMNRVFVTGGCSGSFTVRDLMADRRVPLQGSGHRPLPPGMAGFECAL